MNKTPLSLLALCAALLLPAAARAQIDPQDPRINVHREVHRTAWKVPDNPKDAEAAVRTVAKESRKNLTRLKERKDWGHDWLTFPYGSDGMTLIEKASLQQAKDAVETKRLYWQGVLDVMLAEREKIRAEIEKDKAANDSQNQLAHTKALGKLMEDFKVARAIRDDVSADEKLLKAWERAENPGITLDPETRSDAFKRKTALYIDLKDGKAK